MRVKVKIPKVGLTVTEADVRTWHKQVGDRVRAGELLLTVEADKAAYEVESPVDGVVEEILVPEGETVRVGTVIARVGDRETLVSEAGAQRFNSPPGSKRFAPLRNAPGLPAGGPCRAGGPPLSRPFPQPHRGIGAA